MVPRSVVSKAATATKADKGEKRLVARYDISVAFFHAYRMGGIAVMPPKDMYDGVNLWSLLKAMNGTREASRQWGLYIKDSMVPAGVIGSAAMPGFHYPTEWDIMIACHGDDFLAEGLSEDLGRLDELMKESSK